MGGGTQDFLDGGAGLHGGDKGLMGGGPPPSPPIVGNPGGMVGQMKWFWLVEISWWFWLLILKNK